MQAQFTQNTSHYDGLLGGSSDITMKLCERKSKAKSLLRHQGSVPFDVSSSYNYVMKTSLLKLRY